MKRRALLFALALMLITGTTATAQTEKGYYLIGGNIGNIKANFQNGISVFGIGVSPKVAWFVKDDLAIGGQVNLNFQTATNIGSTFAYFVGPMARYYFTKDELKELVKHTTFFVEANAGVGGTNSSKGGISTNGFDFGIGPGLAFFVNENIALEALAKYNLTAGFGNAPVSSGFNIGVGFQIHLPTSKLKSLRSGLK
ncbi:MAG: hypothetical protein E6Q58_05410 [Niabella sp.]|nr:MAG: hypothetical protein E6Q58_05410 [Niabella sp.]